MGYEYKICKTVEEKDELLAKIKPENLFEVFENQGKFVVFYEKVYTYTNHWSGYSDGYDDLLYEDGWEYIPYQGFIKTDKRGKGKNNPLRTRDYYDGMAWD